MSLETVALFVAIGGQYALLFSLYQKITVALFEMRCCPYHTEMTGKKEPKEGF